MTVNERIKEIKNKRVLTVEGSDLINLEDIKFLIYTLMGYKEALEEISGLDFDDEGSLEIALHLHGILKNLGKSYLNELMQK